MPTPTYTPLANLTLGSAAASVTFSSISGSYRDLILVTSVDSASGGFVWVQFNADTGSNYPAVDMLGDGTGAYSSSITTQWNYFDLSWGSGGNGAISTMNIMDYSTTNKHKTVLVRASKASTNALAFAGRWASTSAITSIKLFQYSTNTFAAGSTFALYGVSA